MNQIYLFNIIRLHPQKIYFQSLRFLVGVGHWLIFSLWISKREAIIISTRIHEDCQLPTAKQLSGSPVILQEYFSHFSFQCIMCKTFLWITFLDRLIQIQKSPKYWPHRCNIMAEEFRFMPLGLVRLRTFRLSASVT